jgi:hypothetical protein
VTLAFHTTYIFCVFLLSQKKSPLGSEINFSDDFPELSTATNLCQEEIQNFHRYKSINLSWQYGFIEVQRCEICI